jgi:hypothetical protein
MLQRLPVAVFHAVGYPSEVPIAFHRHLTAHVKQRMLAGVSRLALEAPPKSLPMCSQLRPKRLDFLNRYAPTLGIKQTFFSMFIRSVEPQSGLM